MEMLVQKLLKSVELFKSYDLLGEPKMVDFLFFNLGKDVKKTMTFLDQFFFKFSFPRGYRALFYSTVSSLGFKMRYYTHM